MPAPHQIGNQLAFQRYGLVEVISAPKCEQKATMP
jgi:hypothetical protein